MRQLLWGWRKIVQIGQTEPNRKVWATRRRTKVRRVAKFVQNAKHFNLEIRL